VGDEKGRREDLRKDLEEIETLLHDIAEDEREGHHHHHHHGKAVSAVLVFLHQHQQSDNKENFIMNVTVHLNDKPLRAFLAEFDGPNGTGNLVPGIGPTSYTSSDPSVATVDPVSGNLVYLKAGQTTIVGLNAGNQLTNSGILTIISGTAQSSDLQFLAQVGSGGVGGALAISTQPASVAMKVGQQAQFAVIPSGGTAPLSYQWMKNGVAIPGAVAPGFVTPVLALTDNLSQYSVKITDAAGVVVTSQPAVLSVS
jgi:hypothetical protein